MCDQIKMIDSKARKVKYVESIDGDFIRTILSITRSIISVQNSLK